MESGVTAQSADKARSEYLERVKNNKGVSEIWRAAQQDRRGLDPRVFEAFDGPELTTEEYAEQLHSVRNKLRAALNMPEVSKEQEQQNRLERLSEENLANSVRNPREVEAERLDHS